MDQNLENSVYFLYNSNVYNICSLKETTLAPKICHSFLHSTNLEKSSMNKNF